MPFLWPLQHKPETRKRKPAARGKRQTTNPAEAKLEVAEIIALEPFTEDKEMTLSAKKGSQKVKEEEQGP